MFNPGTTPTGRTASSVSGLEVQKVLFQTVRDVRVLKYLLISRYIFHTTHVDRLLVLTNPTTTPDTILLATAMIARTCSPHGLDMFVSG
jgi:hypothetical protein